MQMKIVLLEYSFTARNCMQCAHINLNYFKNCLGISFEVLTAVHMKMAVFWAAALCRLV
jgi:hypothetical protein